MGSDITALNRRWSASLAKAAANGADTGQKPLRLSLLISRSIRLRSCAEEKLHQELDAYISDAMVVALATSCNCGGGRPWQHETMRAYMEEAHEAKTWSIGTRAKIGILTPKTRSVVTRTTPRIIGLLGGRTTCRNVFRWWPDQT